MKRPIHWTLGAICLATAAAPTVVGPARVDAAVPPDMIRAACYADVRNALGRFIPSRFNVVVGTAGDDDFGTLLTDGPDLFCGGPGDDYLHWVADPSEPDSGWYGGPGPGDIFVSGPGSATVRGLIGATLIASEDGTVHAVHSDGTIIGGTGRDTVHALHSGEFIGGGGDDHVNLLYNGTFSGGPGNDTVAAMAAGTFLGGDGFDTVADYAGGVVDSVEVLIDTRT